MRLGLILECQMDGTDCHVYKHVIEKLCSAIEIIIIPSGSKNKPEMISICGNVAKTLLEDNQRPCDKVVIIWDLMPVWGGTACRHEDKEAIKKKLKDAGVTPDDPRIKLICIEPELEGWLIADGSALTKYKKELWEPHPVQKFKDKKVSSHSNKAKNFIKVYLERKYDESQDAIKIVKNFDNFDKIARKHESFARLKTFIEEICNH